MKDITRFIMCFLVILILPIVLIIGIIDFGFKETLSEIRMLFKSCGS